MRECSVDIDLSFTVTVFAESEEDAAKMMEAKLNSEGNLDKEMSDKVKKLACELVDAGHARIGEVWCES